MARAGLEQVVLPDTVLEHVIQLCVHADAVGHRAEIVLMRAARARAALDGADTVSSAHVAAVARLALRHRIPRESHETAEDIERRLTQLAA